MLGVRALSNPDGFSKQFKDAAGTKASKALALRCGLLNLQVAALQVAACNADMKVRGHQCGGRCERLGQSARSLPTTTCMLTGQPVST